MKSTLELIADVLTGGEIDGLLIGGYALQCHHIARQTMDVDCLVSDGDAAAFEQALAANGYAVEARTDWFLRLRHPSVYMMDVDVVLVDSATFAEIYETSCDYKRGDACFRVPSVAHLIALKLHAMRNDPTREASDTADVIELLRANEGAVTREQFRTLCEKYGPPGIEQKLCEAL